MTAEEEYVPVGFLKEVDSLLSIPLCHGSMKHDLKLLRRCTSVLSFRRTQLTYFVLLKPKYTIWVFQTSLTGLFSSSYPSNTNSRHH